MNTIIQLHATVRSDHQLHVMLPAHFPEGEVEVSVRSISPTAAPRAEMSQQGIRDRNALFTYLDQIEEIDRYGADERDSWED
jgi:hypothetical protein